METKNIYHLLTMVENLFNSKDGKGMDAEMQDRYMELKKQATVTIRKYPLESLAAGLFAGFVIGKIIKR